MGKTLTRTGYKKGQGLTATDNSVFGDPVDEELVQIGNSIYGDVRSSSSTPVDAWLISQIPIYGHKRDKDMTYTDNSIYGHITWNHPTHRQKKYKNWI